LSAVLRTAGLLDLKRLYNLSQKGRDAMIQFLISAVRRPSLSDFLPTPVHQFLTIGNEEFVQHNLNTLIL
jgi:hypothetical protein